MKKFLLIVLLVILSMFCSKKNEYQKLENKPLKTLNIARIRPQNPDGPSVALNKEEFKIDNGFIYYRGNIFTGKVTYTQDYKQGYFSVNNGILEGESETIYKTTGAVRKEYYKQGKLLDFVQTQYGTSIELIYSENDLSNIKQIITEYGKNVYLIDFENSIGSMSRNGKIISDLKLVSEENGITHISGIFEEDGKTFRIQYHYNSENQKIREVKSNFDSPGKKTEILAEDKLLGIINTKFKEGLKKFETELSIAPENLATVSIQTPEISAQPSLSANTNSSAPPVDEDLALVDELYNEVMNKNNYQILNNFSKEKLGYIRNTIYARKGYIFKKPKYASYFGKKSWYRGVSTSEEVVTENERKFANILLEIENSK